MPTTRKKPAARTSSARRRDDSPSTRAQAAGASLEQLWHVASEWRATVDAAREAIVMIGPDGRIVRANRATRDLFQRSFAELVGARADEVARALFAARDPLRLERARRSERPFRGEIHARDGRWFAVAIDPIAPEDGAWRGAVCHLRDVSDRKRADQRLRRSLRQVRGLAAHLQEEREEERSAIAREIHDRLVHDLTALDFDLTWLRGELPDASAQLDQRVTAMSELANRCLKTLRRISTELRPDLLDHFGAAGAIEWQAEELRLQTGMRTRLDLDAGGLDLPSTISTALFRIVEATLQNVTRRSAATEVAISLHRRGSRVVLRIVDDGRGFDPGKESSFGLLAMRERALALGGDLSIESRRRRGTTVTARLPIA
jgi:PAS domain S-box-containing protein